MAVSCVFSVKFLAENTLNGTNRRAVSGPLGKQDPQVSYIYSTIGCLPGRALSNSLRGHLAFNPYGSFLTPSDHSGGGEELNVQGLPDRTGKKLMGGGGGDR